MVGEGGWALMVQSEILMGSENRYMESQMNDMQASVLRASRCERRERKTNIKRRGRKMKAEAAEEEIQWDLGGWGGSHS